MTDSSIEKLRLIMELRGDGISDLDILNAIERVPREQFVPETFRKYAYDNRALPIAAGQTISQPFIVAFMTQSLELTPRHRVLEIGTGSGYQAMILAQLCRRVYTVERIRLLFNEADRRFRKLDEFRIVTKLGDGCAGWPEQAPFDRIIVTAAAARVPDALTGQLADGGIMILPVGPENGDQTLIRVRRDGQQFTDEVLLPVRFVPLVGT